MSFANISILITVLLTSIFAAQLDYPSSAALHYIIGTCNRPVQEAFWRSLLERANLESMKYSIIYEAIVPSWKYRLLCAAAGFGPERSDLTTLHASLAWEYLADFSEFNEVTEARSADGLNEFIEHALYRAASGREDNFEMKLFAVADLCRILRFPGRYNKLRPLLTGGVKSPKLLRALYDMDRDLFETAARERERCMIQDFLPQLATFLTNGENLDRIVKYTKSDVILEFINDEEVERIIRAVVLEHQFMRKPNLYILRREGSYSRILGWISEYLENPDWCEDAIFKVKMWIRALAKSQDHFRNSSHAKNECPFIHCVAFRLFELEGDRSRSPVVLENAIKLLRNFAELGKQTSQLLADQLVDHSHSLNTEKILPVAVGVQDQKELFSIIRPKELGDDSSALFSALDCPFFEPSMVVKALKHAVSFHPSSYRHYASSAGPRKLFTAAIEHPSVKDSQDAQYIREFLERVDDGSADAAGICKLHTVTLLTDALKVTSLHQWERILILSRIFSTAAACQKSARYLSVSGALGRFLEYSYQFMVSDRTTFVQVVGWIADSWDSIGD